MNTDENSYDVVVIGSGIGGMVCAATLSREGYHVCLIEKNSSFGGCVQSFSRKGVLIDTGVHYVGGLSENEPLYQIFKYNRVLGKVKLLRMDDDAFETLHIQDKVYQYAMGYERIQEGLSRYFPGHSSEIKAFTDLIRTVGSKLSIENFQKGIIDDGDRTYMQIPASKVVEETLSDELVRTVCSGNTTILAGEYDSTPIYHIGMVRHSNITGCYKLIDGSQQLADAYISEIINNGGTVLKSSKVVRISVDDGKVSGVEMENGRFIKANYVISSIHPVETFRILEKTECIRKSYITRINLLDNSCGLFTVYLLMKPNEFPLLNSCHLLFPDNRCWVYRDRATGKCICPNGLMMSTQPYEQDGKVSPHTKVVSIMKLMDYSELAPYADTIYGRRGNEYKEFKERIANAIIHEAESFFPGLSSKIETVYTSSPLTYRDYTGTFNGSAFGICTNAKNLMATLIPGRTRLPNLFLTGQSLTVAGILGTAVTGILTCANLLGESYLAKKIAAC